MRGEKQRIYQAALRGDLDAAETVISYVRRGELSEEDYKKLCECLSELRKRLRGICLNLEASHKEWHAQNIIWHLSFDGWHLLAKKEKKSLCNRFGTSTYSMLGVTMAKSETIPEEARWPTKSETYPKGAYPICRDCLRELYRRNEVAFMVLRDVFVERKRKDDEKDEFLTNAEPLF